MADRKPGCIATERLYRIAMLALPQGHLAHRRFKLGLDLLDVVLDPLALGLRQFVEALRRHDFAIAHRRQREAHRRPQQCDALGRGSLLQAAEGMLTALPE